MTRQEEKIDLTHGSIYYEVTWKILTAKLLPTNLYEEIEQMIENAIYQHEDQTK